MLALLCSWSLTAAFDDQDQKAWIAVVAQAFEANRWAFEHGTIRFRRSVGKAPSFEAAMSGEWSSRSTTEGSCSFDPVRGRYECIYPLADMVARRTRPEGASWSSTLSSERYLTDGKDTLYVSIQPSKEGDKLDSISQITPGTELFYRRMELPNDLGRPGLRSRFGLDLAALTGDQANTRVNLVSVDRSGDASSTQSLDLVVRAEFKSQTPESRETHYRIDLKRGSIPIEQHDRMDVNGTRFERWTIQDDLREVAGKGWVPYHLLHYLGKTASVSEIVLLEADFAKAPTASEFRLEFDEPIRVRDQVRKLDYPPAKVLDMAHLPTGAGVHSWREIPPDAAAGPTMPGERPIPSSARWWWLAVGCGLLLAALAVFRRRA